jgi:hypothetical protein
MYYLITKVVRVKANDVVTIQTTYKMTDQSKHAIRQTPFSTGQLFYCNQNLQPKLVIL